MAMRRPYSPAYRQKLLKRLTGPEAVTACYLSKETGVPQQTLSRWLQQAKDLPHVAKGKGKKPKKRRLAKRKRWSIAEKARILGAAEALEDEELGAFLRREGVHPDQLNTWRHALDDTTGLDRAAKLRIKELERELRRKEKALAEAAALLVLKKKMREIWGDADEDTTE